MRYSVLIDSLQNLTNSKVDISEIAKVIGKPARTLYTRGQRDTEFKQSEINQIEEFYKVNLSKSDTSNNNSVTLDYYPDVFGIGLTAAKKAIKDLINEGLIIKSKRSKVQGNYNKYLITPKVQNLTSERAQNECFKKSDSDLLLGGTGLCI